MLTTSTSRHGDLPGARWLPGISRLLAALSVLAGGVVSSVQAAPQGGARAGVGPAPAEEGFIRDPRQTAEQLVSILAKQKSPWQLYRSYERIYFDFADKEIAKRPASKQAATYQTRLVEHLQQMGGLLQQMGDCAKTRSDIRMGLTEIPFERRQDEYSDATIRHATLLKQFAALATQLPASKTRPIPTGPATRNAPQK